ncbi:hybrid PKS-NRPS PsoA [Xylaria intraflava]|nr:hybrid PKS-NRPS PsoA [Xylaria intraflava]
MLDNAEPIAIVGSSCRLPGGSNSPSKLWELLKDPRDLLRDVPQSRFNAEAFYHKNGEHHGSSNVLKSYFLDEDPKLFDHDFFNIHPKEAESMDPQQRLLLETVYEGIESAGYSMHSLRGSSTAVYVGQMTADYSDVLLRDVDSAPQYYATGTSRSIMSNRVSYFFDWKGPSVTIDTACSSSLVALHHAVQTLRNGESTLAVVGGVNLILGPELYIFESKLRMLSPTGRSRMWDSAADGYARGEGFATVVLKTLQQALTDNDHIECVIRGTGVNQDGRTPGITMPSADSQVALIRSTYTRAGLDVSKPEDRCQYFEAHGTGTLAGDSKEAEAIQRVFFPKVEGGMEHQLNCSEADESGKLSVGSIKTVVGHLEGAAGLAGLIKASLAVQHALIPPNMHFHNLNPAIEPFYSQLHVPTQLQQWPVLPANSPRRASINSFGFGGTNCHVIIESWDTDQKQESQHLAKIEPQATIHLDSDTSTPDFWGGPFPLSAQSPSALKSMVTSLYKTIESTPEISLGRLAWTLQTRRTEFQFKTSISAPTRGELVTKLRNIAHEGSSWAATSAQTLPANCSPRILGIFTGQGAQWPAMGSILYAECAVFRNAIDRLDASLAALPTADRPPWSLASELQAPPDTSRVMSAVVSQPLCTAVQLALVDLLRSSGIVFSAVLGHSSGEIAAVYAAGYLNAYDAIRIAYYRGFHSHLAGNSGKKGMMIAVGMSYGEALKFCQKAEFRGRIVLAASNSRSSVTLSGDEDAINEAKEFFDKNQTFSRLLKVDTAYHSHHMLPCAAPYLESLRHCDIQLLAPQDTGCQWYSSVYGPDGRSIDDPSAFKDQYWVDNLVHPVLFSQALDRAVTEEHCHDMVLEVGPHPALKGPVSDTLKNLTGLDLPYTGVLSRGENDMTAFTDALGRVWNSFLHTATPMPDFCGFQKACQGEGYSREPLVMKGLPPYTWVHETPLWRESIQSRKFRTRKYPVHELLGSVVTHGNGQEMRWRNVMKLSEIPWVDGHRFQDQILFPAAGYVSMAIEAAVLLASQDQISPTAQLVELVDLKIHQAITLEEKNSGTEVIFAIRLLKRDGDRIIADYSCYSGDIDANSESPEKVNFTGQAIVTLGDPTLSSLPSRVPIKLPLSDVPLSRLYGSLADIGLKYSGDFLVESAQRRHGLATVSFARHSNSALIVHPSKLDAAFHGLFTAFSFPGDGQLWAPYLPTSIRSVRVSLDRCSELEHGHDKLSADCHLEVISSKMISGSIDVFCAAHNGHHPEIQVEGLSCVSFTKATPSHDKKLFLKTLWKSDVSSGLENSAIGTSEGAEFNEATQRVVYFYLRRLRNLVSRDEISSMEWQFQCQMQWILDHALPTIEAGLHPRINKEWATDTDDQLAIWREKYKGRIDMEISIAIGENLPAIVRGQIPVLQVMLVDNMLNRFYQESIQFVQANRAVAQTMSQLSHRYPHLDLLEIGAGTGGTTKSAVRALNDFGSYTYTDISPGFFQGAQEVFKDYAGKMKYRLLDIENDPIEQGYEPHSFDVLIASNVLHATKVLANTLRNCRRLLRPGGFLVLMEITEDDIRPGFIMSALPGWWLGREDGRKWAPTISQVQWDSVFLETGFTGIDTICEMAAYDTNSVMITQAVDDRVTILREPLANPDLHHVQDIVIVGGSTLPVAGIVRKIKTLLRPFADRISVAKKLEDFASQEFPRSAAIICLSELENSAWESMTSERFNGMQNMILSARQLLWIVRGRRAQHPYSNMFVGMCRSIVHESPHIKTQFLDIETTTNQAIDPALLSEALLRLVALDNPDFQDILWSLETELIIEGGKLLIPRIVQDDELNILTDSDRRAIDVEVDPATTAVEVVEGGDSLVMRKFTPPRIDHSSDHFASASIQVSASSLFPFITIGGLPLFLSIGKNRNSGEKVLALASTNSSSLDTSLSEPFVIKSDADDGMILTEALLTLFVESLFVATKTVLWVHNANKFLCKLLLKAAVTHEKKVFLSTSGERNDTSRTFIHPCTTRRGLRLIVPTDVSNFIDMRPGKSHSLASLCQSMFGNRVITLPLTTIADNVGRAVSLNYGHSHMMQALNRFVLRFGINENRSDFESETDTIEIQNFEPGKPASECEPFSVVRWDGMQTALARAQPIDPKSLFSSQKTYLLVGLTGELGLSLCQWMADHGARHVAITSRRPKVDEAVIEDLHQRGLNLRIFSLDIADMEGLKSVVEDIRSTMPPIGGVANAAMVLLDKPFDTLSLEDYQVVLGPKVNGSRNLDQCFSSDNLDFFIMFSSISSVVGAKGQSNYAAANLYMHSLAQQRRNRGVAASIIDIPVLLGVGFIARSLDQYEETMKRLRITAISEVDFRSAFAAAIISGRPDSSHGPELMVGITASSNAPWSNDPRFAYCLRDDSQAAGAKSAEQRSDSPTLSQSPKVQLASAQSSDEALAVIETAFARKLQLILQVTDDKIDHKVPLMKLGIDSLVAVEVRSFFLKEFTIDMPVLKVLGGASILDLCRDALARLPDELKTFKRRIQPAVQQNNEQEDSKPSHESPSASEDESAPSPSHQLSESGSTGQGDSVAEIVSSGLTTPSVEKPINDPSLYERTGEMSFSQARLYFLHVYLEDASTYNVTMGGKITGTSKLDVNRFQQALRQVCLRHEGLRTAFFISHDTGKAIQAVNVEPDVVFVEKTVENTADVEVETKRLKKYHHNIEYGQGMKVMVLSTPDSQHVLFSYHHIVLDGFSWGIFLNDLDRAYSGYNLELDGSPSQAIDMSMMQRRANEPGQMEDEIEYWRKVFIPPPDTLPLFPFSRVKSRQILREFDSETFEFSMDGDLSRQLKVASRAIGVTPFYCHLSCLVAFVTTVLNVKDFSLGITDAGRQDSDYVQTIGYFLNLLPLRFRMEDPNLQFDELARNTRDHVHEALANSRLDFDAILDQLQIDRSGNQNPLFQIVLNYRMGGAARNRLGPRSEIEWTDAIAPGNPYDLIVDVTDTPEFTHIAFTTQRYLYSESDSRMMMNRYLRVMEGLMRQPTARVADCLSSSTKDIEQAIALGRGEHKNTDWPATVSQRIQEMAIRYTDSLAVKVGSGYTQTYGQLVGRANDIANELTSQGVEAGSGAYIGVLLKPTADVVASLLAIMQLGLIYVPLDTRNSTGRLSSIVKDCQPAALICHPGTHEEARALAGSETTVINLAALQVSGSVKSLENYAEANKPGFAMYTSGSTGEPKGVLLLHSNVLNQIWAISERYGIGREVVLQQSSFGFDMALEQVLVALANGGIVVMAPEETRGDFIQLANLILDENVTYTELVPSEYLSLLRYGSRILRRSTTWRFAFSGGERVTPHLRRAFKRLEIPNLQLINVFGPTETSVSCTRGVIDYRASVLDEGDSFSGYVMPNYSVIILDHQQKPLPIGLPGEIYIGGAGTAVGYVNRPLETSSKFIRNSFATPDDIAKGWSTLYRSGDRGRLLEDGSLHFLGRITGDSQVKIHGIRIELDEIASVIIKSATVIIDAAVSWRPATELLVAFVVFEDDFQGDKNDFLGNLQLNLPLPSYMCPSSIVPIQKIPINPNGKKDRIAIDSLEISSHQRTGKMDVISLTEMETSLKRVWEEVIPSAFARSNGGLNIDESSDFFRTGGNSLLLVKLQLAIRATFGCRVSLPELFQSSTLRSMALRVEAAMSGSPNPVLALPVLDWHHEVASLMEGLPEPVPATDKARTKARESGLVVILTGATGFLGRYLLSSLVKSKAVREIHCLAIRPGPNGEPRHVASHVKVVEHAGDLSDQYLGLSVTMFKELSDRADLIIHNGADVSFLKSYASLRHTNVIATRTLLEMAIPRSIPFHFISTASVAQFSLIEDENTLGLAERSLANELPGQAKHQPQAVLGYATSKWVSESLVERAVAEFNLSGCGVHRLTTAIGEDAPKTDLINALRSYSQILKAVPYLADGVQGTLDLLPVEDVAQRIVESAFAVIQADATIEFVHHCSETGDRFRPQDFGAYMERTFGGVYDKVSLDVWLDRARDAGLDELVYDYLKSSTAGPDMIFPTLQKAQRIRN